MAKKKRSIVKKILLIIAAVILVLIAADVIITEVYAHKIPHHFASAEEGRELLLANTEYYSHFTQNDIDYRLNRSGGTLDELMQATADEIKGFNILERFIMDHNIAKMVRTLERNGYELPPVDEIIYINTPMTTEGIAAGGYTHGNEIYLNSVNILTSVIPGGDEYFEHLMWHELFHVLTRNNPGFRADAYSLIHFTVADHDFEIPPCLKTRMYSNPDVEHHNAYATFNIDGQDVDCFLVWVVTEDYTEGSNGAPTAVALVPVDGTDISYAREQALNFDEVLGTNSDYVTDPEEYMADNFADAMQYGIEGREGQGYPNPEIIQGVIDLL
ncbi:MAG: hypothetical protein IKP14_08240 [Clostridiales bacterium]|nr:hypothetical protein [Clostridiales bacterium]